MIQTHLIYQIGGGDAGDGIAWIIAQAFIMAAAMVMAIIILSHLRDCRLRTATNRSHPKASTMGHCEPRRLRVFRPDGDLRESAPCKKLRHPERSETVRLAPLRMTDWKSGTFAESSDGAMRSARGFSLVEVVLAMAIFVFAGFALIGLFALGLQNGNDSKERFQAATIAEAICATLRAAPTTDFTISPGAQAQQNFPLPALTVTAPVNNFGAPVGLTWDGNKTTTGLVTDPKARFGLLYSIIPSANYGPPTTSGGPSVNPGTATVYLYIYWPAPAALTANPSHFELTTTFALP